MNRTLVLGVDAGATATRCVVATLDGVVVGRGAAGGANRNSSGGRAAETLGVAIEAALSGSRVERSAVRLGVLGAAGSAGTGRSLFCEAATLAWTRAGLTGEVVTVTDLEVAFAAGTPGGEGTLLLSGTGALAARFAGGVPERRADGYGWLLGDEGSAVWMGVRALRAALAALDGRGEPTSLVHLTADLLGIGPPGGQSRVKDNEPATGGLSGQSRADTGGPAVGRLSGLSRADDEGPPAGELSGLPGADRGGAGAGEAGGLSRVEREELAQALVAAGFARPPAELGLLAPAVSSAADAGDLVARRIADAAAVKLLRAFDAVGPPVGAVVLAGSVLLSPGPVARAVRAGVLARAGVEPRAAVDGAGGAAALAVALLTGRPVPPVMHARLTGGASAGRGHEPSRE